MTLQVMALLCQWMFLRFIVMATLSLVAATQPSWRTAGSSKCSDSMATGPLARARTAARVWIRRMGRSISNPWPVRGTKAVFDSYSHARWTYASFLTMLTPVILITVCLYQALLDGEFRLTVPHK